MILRLITRLDRWLRALPEVTSSLEDIGEKAILLFYSKAAVLQSDTLLNS